MYVLHTIFLVALSRNIFHRTIILNHVVHEDERPHEEIVELLQRSLSLDETQSPIPVHRNHHAADGDESGFLVGSSDSSVEG